MLFEELLEEEEGGGGASGRGKGTNSGGGRGPKGRPLDLLLPVCLGRVSHPEDQSRNLECKDGCMGVRRGTGSLGSVGSSTPSSLCRAKCHRQVRAEQTPTRLYELVKTLLAPFLLGLLVF